MLVTFNREKFLIGFQSSKALKPNDKLAFFPMSARQTYFPEFKNFSTNIFQFKRKPTTDHAKTQT